MYDKCDLLKVIRITLLDHNKCLKHIIEINYSKKVKDEIIKVYGGLNCQININLLLNDNNISEPNIYQNV